MMDGAINRLKRNLDETPVATSGHTHNLMGLWSDEQRNVYVAVASQRKVQRISPDGGV